MKKNVLMQLGVVASFLLVAIPSHAKHCCDFKIDALNRQALSLKEHCVSIKEFVDCISTDCCGGGSCPCAPTAITASTTEITEPGSYCLSEDVFSTITVTTDEGVIIDLNGYTVSSLILGNNCKVKNGTVYGLGVGSNTFVSNVRINGVTGNGAGSSVLLVDCSRLTNLQNVERVVMARCAGDGVSFLNLRTGVKDVTMYDSVFSYLNVPVDSFDIERLVLHRTMIKDAVVFGISDALQELLLYQSVIGGEIQLNFVVAPKFEHMVIEESQIGRVAMFFISDESQKVNALFQRTVFEGGITAQKFDGLVVRKCQLAGPLDLITDNNVEIDNVSAVAVFGGSAITISAGKNILLTDCCATAPGTDQIGYMTSSGVENLNLIRCYAKDCYLGFYLNSAVSCLVKDCVCDGSTGNSFSGNSSTTRAVGNLALSLGGVPAANYNPSSGAPFDIDVMTTFTLSSVSALENTLERSAWRNMSFELP